MGHVHLHVRDLAEAEAFYRGLLGFDMMLRWPPSALFMSAGGYHHHIGLNTWAGVGAPPPPEDAAGLKHFTIELPDRSTHDSTVDRLRAAGVPVQEDESGALIRDPSQNGILLRVA
jgi:catechol 2,3-dioxygenase